jgi:hypothetical protein
MRSSDQKYFLIFKNEINIMDLNFETMSKIVSLSILSFSMIGHV